MIVATETRITILRTARILRCALLLAVVAAGCWLAGCVTPTTRTEQDTYTLTIEDTTKSTVARNKPGARDDNGIVYPSARTTEIERGMTQRDSVVTREYPAFIRLGAFESIGLIGSGNASNGIGAGLFGIYYDPADFLSDKIQGRQSGLFTGAIYRFGIAEYRLRWFRDAANWTIGTHGVEMIYPEASNSKTLISVLPLYVRKRFYLREEIPYVAATISTGLGFYPSQYINLSGSLDVGSIGGLNIRAYAGFAAGANRANSALNDSNSAVTAFIPYAGIGISVLDFLNRVPELYREWKDHEHSSWSIGVANLTLMNTSLDTSILTRGSFPLKGFQLQIAPVCIAIPWELLRNRLYVGTELFNLVIAGAGRQRIAGRNVDFASMGLGILPLRVGYWYPVLSDELSAEPFIEYSYLPSSMIQLGAKLNLFLTQRFNIGLNAGYISSSGIDLPVIPGIQSFLERAFGRSMGAFSTAYIGLSVGIQSRIFFPDEVRYNRPDLYPPPAGGTR
ncbi:MAG: hypothetical protein JNL32_01075 [Candidatus Kapabacteria bacterium]|nr:hypothetical protein [Candidatus Kapabacteria bacterium]